MAPGERRRRSVIAKLVELAIALLVVLTPASALALTRASVVENASALAALHAKTRVRGFELAPAEIASGFELSSARNASGKSARGRGEGVRVHHRNRVWSPELGAFLSPDEFGYVTTEGTLWSWPNQNPIAIRDPFGTGESRADSIFNWLSSGNFGFGFAMYARGMEQRRQGLLDLAATGGESIGDVQCGTQKMAAGLEALTTEATIAVGMVGGAGSALRTLAIRAPVVQAKALTGIQANKLIGNAAADELAMTLRQGGLTVEREVFYRTPFGARFADLRVSSGDQVLGLVEVKVGESSYTAFQRAKDAWISYRFGHITNVVRYPSYPYP